VSPVPDFVLDIRRMIGTHPLWLPGVTAVIRRGDEILMVERADNGAWTPVTGIVDPGEEPAVAAAREALEEAGVVISVDRLASTSVMPEVVYDNGDRAAYLDLTFACTWLSGEAYVADDESTDVRWWPLDALPPLSASMAQRVAAALSDEREARFVTAADAAPLGTSTTVRDDSLSGADHLHPRTLDEPEVLRPERPVLGVDACPAGWVGVLVAPSGRATVHVAGSITDLVALVRQTADPAVVAIDIPIGLPDSGGRRADAEARRQLVGKGSSVFPTLTRAAYEADTYELARAANLAATGGELSASAQAYALGAKILEVDAWVRSGPGAEVIEVHPELSFARMAGSPVVARKKDEAGVRARREALLAYGLTAPAWFRGAGFGEDDLLDACACAWSAARHERGASESFPAEPEVFGDGIPAAIRV
jgi:predicted RNase H-like nuclease/ADP-ribose pyrophosphatase YjhB (NUDIX family)